jgi:3-hydroxybutyryl-CoA dehydrogenase
VAAGLFGRKSGEGWYRYDPEGKKVMPQRRGVPPGREGLRVWFEANTTDALRAHAEKAGVPVVHDPQQADLAVVQPWGADATTTALSLGVDPAKTVAVDPMTPFELRRTLMLTSITTPQARDAAHALFATDGTPVTVINDSAGFIAQRVMATIVNIAANIAQRGIASVADLEDSVKLGLGYPHGPLSWGDCIGAANILATLRAQQKATGDPRYRPSPWLVRRVALGLPLVTPEAAR